MDVLGFQIVSLIACGMGVAVWITDRNSPTSRALGLFLASMGGVILASAHVPLSGPLPWWTHFLGVLDTMAFMAGSEWGIRVGETVASKRIVAPGRFLVRTAQMLIIAYAGIVAWNPEPRARGLTGTLDLNPATHADVSIWWVAAPWLLAIVLVGIAGFRVLRERPDKAEAARIASMMAVMPLFALSLALPAHLAPISIAIGEIVFITGALRYHNVQGARGMFMAQFLSPQVAELVRKRGLKNAMNRQRQVVTVVCVDIRGFTAFAASNTPEKVMRLLRDFYGAVGAAAAEFGGTIKDLAGDGALILLGAPVAYDDHAKRGLAMARRLQDKARPVAQRYSN